MHCTAWEQLGILNRRSGKPQPAHLITEKNKYLAALYSLLTPVGSMVSDLEPLGLFYLFICLLIYSSALGYKVTRGA